MTKMELYYSSHAKDATEKNESVNMKRTKMSGIFPVEILSHICDLAPDYAKYGLITSCKTMINARKSLYSAEFMLYAAYAADSAAFTAAYTELNDQSAASKWRKTAADSVLISDWVKLPSPRSTTKRPTSPPRKKNILPRVKLFCKWFMENLAELDAPILAWQFLEYHNLIDDNIMPNDNSAESSDDGIYTVERSLGVISIMLSRGASHDTIAWALQHQYRVTNTAAKVILETNNPTLINALPNNVLFKGGDRLGIIVPRVFRKDLEAAVLYAVEHHRYAAEILRSGWKIPRKVVRELLRGQKFEQVRSLLRQYPELYFDTDDLASALCTQTNKHGTLRVLREFTSLVEEFGIDCPDVFEKLYCPDDFEE